MAASLNLDFTPPHTAQFIWFRRPDGSLDSVPAIRLFAYVNFMHVLVRSPAVGRYAITEGVVDTGSNFSIISEGLWRLFVPGYVTPLPFDALTPRTARAVTIAGGTFPYTLGELTLRLEDRTGTVLPVTVVAKLTQDGGRLSLPLALGLRGGFLEGRRLRADPDASAAFGQVWALSEP